MVRKLLVVDDESDILRVVVFRLKKYGYEVHSATDGKSALDMAPRVAPDLIVLDYRMPGMNGLEVCRRLKDNADTRHIPVLIFTASSDDMAERMRESGADGYLLKPVEPNQLFAAIEEKLNKK